MRPQCFLHTAQVGRACASLQLNMPIFSARPAGRSLISFGEDGAFIQMQYIVSSADKTARRIGVMIDIVELSLSCRLSLACCVFR